MPNHVADLVDQGWHLTANVKGLLDLASVSSRPPNPNLGGDLCLMAQQRGNFAQHWHIINSDVAGYYWLWLGNQQNYLGRLDVFMGNQNPGNNGRVCHAPNNPTTAQKWEISRVGGQPGYFYLKAQVSNMNLAIRPNNNVWEIVQVDPTNPHNNIEYQKWLIH